MSETSKPDPRWGYRARTDETPDSEVLATDFGPIWGRIFDTGVLPDGWYASPAQIPVAATTDDAPKSKKAKPTA